LFFFFTNEFGFALGHLNFFMEST